MAKYDPDRIAALAAGSLEPAEAAALEAEIAGDPRAAAELAAQRLAVGALRGAPSPVLTADERNELRRAVAAALHLDEAPAAAAAAPRRRFAWRPLAVAAATLAALVAVVPLFGLLSAGDDEAAMTTVAIAATTEARGDAPSVAEGDGLQTFGTEQTNPEMLGASTTAAATTTTAPAAGMVSRQLEDADKAVDGLITDPAPLFAAAAAVIEVPCGREARTLLEDDDPRGALLSAADPELAIWFLSADGAAIERLVAFDPTSCLFLAAYP